MRQCRVYVHGKYAGILSERNVDDYRFVYDSNYLDNEDCRPVCIAMPKSRKEFSSRVLFPFFFNMLSEGANRDMQSELLHIDGDDDFGILLSTAQDDTPGAVTVEPLV